ncbi:EscC/YscC/HrcC family type III secretion system outer membrane ring protein [Shewanella sp. VB17]|uniref:EscC/YscC/HrcC family type III secretion system outer membrane ring protein n=1 Tax=Shewanella sp. VB17 TaxID=2739432 RepID=UPI0015653D2C|nr:EscC/YscC/HrcC family type III secretion system outer membrane ring protein [Shewanella sp. VB17]NRD74534.1 EscC/YscC/HrcC family type III secretion system outer membrane ring protein [Shewanella sp. VB17]
MKTFICLLLLFNFTLAQAMPLTAVQWQGDPFVMISRGTSLASVLQDFGSNYGVPVVISDKITDKYVGTIQDQAPQQVIKELSHRYGLVWYYNNEVLYVYKASEITNEVISLTSLPAAKVSQYLTSAGVLDVGVCSIKSVAGISGLQVSGVPACIQSVTKLTEQLDASAKKTSETQEAVRVYPLKYASATDSVYQYRSQSVKIPGLVTVLKDMDQGTQIADATAGVTSSNSGPVFAADPRRNAIIVRGSARDMATYGSLIKQLDTKPTMIEVSVSILDVVAGDFKKLGIDWSASAKLGGGSVSFNSDNGNGNFSTVIGNTGNFMVKLNALEQNSKAKVLSRPSVVTLNNVQAILDKNITFYTKVQGEKVAKLESVTTGSLLRVTPRLIDEAGHQAVMLNLNIQDGRQSQAVSKSEPIPQVENSEISTQATLKSGESLLIGGFVQDRDETTQNKIPLLGDIPLLGGLFRSTDHSTQSVMRLFLIKAEPVNQGD